MLKKNYPDYDIITRKLDDNTYWTFKRTEKRDLHEEDIYKFTHMVYQDAVDALIYFFIDPFLYKRREIKKTLRTLDSLAPFISYKHDDMIYIYGQNLVFGVDLSLLEFIGIKRDKIIRKISEKSHVFLDKNTIFIKYKDKIENLDNQVKYIPYLYSIENG